MGSHSCNLSGKPPMKPWKGKEGNSPTGMPEGGPNRIVERFGGCRSARLSGTAPSTTKASGSHDRYAFHAGTGSGKPTEGPENGPKRAK